MKLLLLCACLLATALGASVAPPTTSSTLVNDTFIGLIKAVEAAPFFRLLPESYRVLTFEMLTAAETNQLNVVLDRLGHLTLLRYLNALPKTFSHDFIAYSIKHLEAEGAPDNSLFQ